MICIGNGQRRDHPGGVEGTKPRVADERAAGSVGLGDALGLARAAREILSRVVFEIPAQAACFLTPFSNSTPSMTSASSFAPFNTLHRF